MRTPSGCWPRGHTARSERVRSRSRTGTRTTRPAATSSATASSLSTAGPAPAATAERSALVLASSSSGVASGAHACRASSSAVRVPEVGSRWTRRVAASVSGASGLRSLAHG